MKKSLTVLASFLLVLSLVLGASVHLIDFEKDDVHEVTAPVRDMIEFFHGEDFHIRTIILGMSDDEGSASIRLFIKEGDVTAPASSVKIRDGQSAGIDLNQDGDHEYVIYFVSADKEKNEVTLRFVKNELQKTVSEEPEVINLENESESSSLVKKTLLVGGIILAIIILFFIFKKEDEDLKKDPKEGGFVIDSTKK